MIHLPSGYVESRELFLEKAGGLGAEVRSFAHEADAGTGAPLSSDVALLGPKDAEAIIVVCSGTHGVEGYAGAACQLRFMERYSSSYADSNIAYVLLHAVNPWGFLHDRRVTRENIDLNRNFIDFDCAAKAGSGYGAYHDILISNYRPMPRGLWNELRLIAGALTPARWKAAQAAITSGQYSHPDGLFFGGYGPCESRTICEEIIRTYVTGYKYAFLLDLHPGLGKSGEGELISYLPAPDPRFKRMAAWFGSGMRSMATGDSVSAAVDGSLTAAFERMTTAQSHALGLEFGTRPPLAVLNALRADQWYQNNQQALSPLLGQQIRRKMNEAFVVADPSWRSEVARRFDEVMDELTRAAESMAS
jgi:hypothetical protein